MANPRIPVAPGVRATIGVGRPLYFNRFAGHAATDDGQRQRQSIGEATVTLRGPGRHPVSTTGTLEADGHVGVVDGLMLELLGAGFMIADGPVPHGTNDSACRTMLEYLGYQGYSPTEYVSDLAQMVYDFQIDHHRDDSQLRATGTLDDETRTRIREVFDTAVPAASGATP